MPLDQTKYFRHRIVVIKKNFTVLKATDVFRWLLQYLTVSKNVSFAGRDLSYTQTQWDGEYDDPKTIIDEAIEAQNNLLCGFFGNDKANKEKLEESKTPTNAAISLAGEPMLYPEIDELIAEFNRL